MKVIYCSKCNKQLIITTIALKQYGKVIQTIEPHECVSPPLEFDFQKVTIPTPGSDIGQKSTKLSFPSGSDTLTLRDQRSPEVVKSTAPQSILEQIEDLKGGD